MKVFTTVLLVVAAVSAAPSHPSLGVIGGQDAELGQFPSIVSLQRKGIIQEEPPFVHVCAGIIVSPTTILTAAHCVDRRGGDVGIDAVKVVAGVLNIEGGNDTFRQELPIGTISIHPNYNKTLEEFGIIGTSDLAIVKLDGSFTFNDIVNYSQLPEEDDVLGDGDIAMFAGWGENAKGSHLVEQNNLQAIAFPILNYQDCYDSVVKIFENPLLVTIDKKLSLCTGPLNNDEALAIFGDEGGPLIKNGVVYGLHSWTENYLISLLPPDSVGPSGVFVKLSSFVSWIRENVSDL